LRPWQVAELALQALEAERIPAPSFFVASGRGVALVWLHTPVPRAALPRWNACQRRIYEALRHLGADARARDAARVLRLIGSRHGETGAIVEALTPAGPPWPFDTLADEILPLTRPELYDLRIRRAAKRAARPQEALVRPPEGFTQATLWEARLTDLQTLLQLRWFGHLPPGHRDKWLFLAGVAMSWLAIPLVLQRELYALAHQVGGWTEAEASNRLQAVLARAHAAARGETVDWMGQAIDPRYRFRTETILEWLEITPEEQRHMRTLIGPEIARERHAEAERERKRRTGEVKIDRATYLAQAEERRQEARRLREQGMSLREIAKALGVSPEAVRRMLNR
ncbi:MAG: helix-turn-helix domain-containing protein, partial [Armatimonadota bacterium]|nr:helix-turn-helix domain-containing protein [Armatimonadota bacterium]